MVADELRALLSQKISTDKRIAALLKKIAAGRGSFGDTMNYALISGELTGEQLAEVVLELTDDREELVRLLVHDRWEDINEQCAAVQTAFDKHNALHLAPQKASFPAERVMQIAHSLSDPTVSDDTIRRRARSVSNVVVSMHDDFIEANAKFRSGAGLQCFVTRVTDGSCCPWCTRLAGRYRYPEDIPDEIFSRHDNCGCTVTYENGRKRQDVWSKRTWEVPDKEAGSQKPTVFSREQGQKLQADNAPKRLTEGDESGIIDIEEKLRSIGFDKVDTSFFKNVNKDMQSAITDQLTLLEEKFKAISSSNKPTISADLKGGSTACVRSELNNPENQKLMLSSRQFKNRKKHIADRRKDVEDFFCMPCNTDDETLSRYVVTHEYGHMLENSIAAQDMKGTINTFPRLTERYREQIEKIARTIDTDYDKNKSKYLSRYVREETPYGHKDLEFFAECFANSQLGQPNVLGQAMLQWLEKRGFNVL